MTIAALRPNLILSLFLVCLSVTTASAESIPWTPSVSKGESNLPAGLDPTLNTPALLNSDWRASDPVTPYLGPMAGGGQVLVLPARNDSAGQKDALKARKLAAEKSQPLKMPEPASLTLLGIGLVVIALLRRW